MNKISTYIIFLFLLFIVVRFFVPFNGLYGQDAFEYMRYAERLRVAILTGIHPGDYFWPLGFPLYGALFSFVFQDISFSLQFISFSGFIMCFYFSSRIIEMLYPENKNEKIYLFLFLGLSPFFLRSSMVVMSDMACAGFIIAAFYYSFKYSYLLKLKYILLFVFCFANAIMFRYAAAVVLLPVIVWTGFIWLKQKDVLQLLLGSFLTIVIFLPHYLIRKQNSVVFLNHAWLTDWNLKNYFFSSFVTLDGYFHYLFPNGIYYILELFHPGYFAVGVLLIVYLLKHIRQHSFFEKLMDLSVLIYLLFLMGIPLQNPRFCLLIIPLFAVVLYPGFNLLYQKINLNKLYLFFMIVVLQIALFFISFKPFFERNKLEQAIFKYLQTETDQPVLYSFDMDISLKGYGLKKELNNLWVKKYETFSQHSLVLFNPSGFEKQWKYKNPMINWEKMNKEYHLTLIKQFDKGWMLYEID